MKQRNWRLMVAVGLATILVLIPSLGTRTALARQAAAGPVRGGTVHVAFAGGVATFDPAQSYNNDWWLINGTLFNGLYQLDRNGVPQLDLAAAPPAISADHLVWTFKLRHGVLFHNGMEMTAYDLAFSITRTLDPHLKLAASWGQPTDDIFKGSHDFITGKAKSVAGIQALDRYTIRFTLNQPVAVFPYILASTFNMVVPRGVVMQESADYFPSHPIGTGPFMLQSWKPGVQAVFVRNPHYFRPGKPYLDKIVVDTNDPASLIALKVEKGELDGFGNSQDIAAADLEHALGDPTLAHYVVNSPSVLTGWLNLNVHAAPLDNAKLRQAIALAINRPHMVRLLAGTAVAANQLYIPLDPQHDPALDARPVYPYDVQRATALVKASGYKGQPITVLFANDTAFEINAAPAVQQDLQQIGLNVKLRGVSSTALHALQGPLNGAQISFQAFSADFPDAFDIYSVELSCSANAAGGSGAAHYCDPTADVLVNRAESLPLGAARDGLLRQAQMRMLQSATRIPLIYLKNIELASPRIGGFYYQPLFGWQYENYWLKS